VPADALALALGAAVLHAIWNLLLARAADVEAATAVMLGTSAVFFAPVAAVTWDVEPSVWPYALASASFELAYFALLAYAYSSAALSVVYPISRGAAPVLVLLATLAALTWPEAAGVLVVATGVVLVRGLRDPDRRGALLGLVLAFCIAGYTLLDDRGIRHADAFAYFELVIAAPGLVYLAWVVHRHGAAAVRRELNPRTVFAGIAASLAYVFILLALRRGDAAPVAAVRETSVVIAVGLAALFLRERVGRGRALGAVLVVAGIALLAGCGGESTAAGGERAFEVEHVLLGERGIVLVGTGVGGRIDESCGTRRELVAVELSFAGRRTGVTDFPLEDLGDCVRSIDDASLDGDGIVVSGWLELDSSEGQATAAPYGARLELGAGPDTSFGDAGSLGLPHPTSGLAPSGRRLVYAGGVVFARNGDTVDDSAFRYDGQVGRIASGPPHGTFVVLHRESSGSYDAFTLRGRRQGNRASVRFAEAPPFDEVTGLELSPLGWLVFVTHAVDNYTYRVYRHLPDGRLDRRFGRNGHVLVAPTGGSLEVVTDIAATFDGGVVAAGQLDHGRRRKAFVVRFDGAGRRRGLVLADLGPRTDHLFADARTAVAVGPNGDVVLAASIAGRPTKVFLFDPAGRLDRSFGDGGIATLSSL
jgi:drug/metabolite transporter (DMT)-like permease